MFQTPIRIIKFTSSTPVEHAECETGMNGRGSRCAMNWVLIYRERKSAIRYRVRAIMKAGELEMGY